MGRNKNKKQPKNQTNNQTKPQVKTESDLSKNDSTSENIQTKPQQQRENQSLSQAGAPKIEEPQAYVEQNPQEANLTSIKSGDSVESVVSLPIKSKLSQFNNVEPIKEDPIIQRQSLIENLPRVQQFQGNVEQQVKAELVIKQENVNQNQEKLTQKIPENNEQHLLLAPLETVPEQSKENIPSQVINTEIKQVKQEQQNTLPVESSLPEESNNEEIKETGAKKENITLQNGHSSFVSLQISEQVKIQTQNKSPQNVQQPQKSEQKPEISQISKEAINQQKGQISKQQCHQQSSIKFELNSDRLTVQPEIQNVQHPSRIQTSTQFINITTQSIEVLDNSPRLKPEITHSNQQYIERMQQVRQIHQNSNQVIDINQPIQITSPVQKQETLIREKTNQIIQQPKPETEILENRLFTMVESEQIPTQVISKDNAAATSTEINQRQIDINELSFSDINFQGSKSVQKSNNHKENKQSEPEKQNINKPNQELKELEKQQTEKTERIKRWLSFDDQSQSNHPTWDQVFEKQKRVKQWLSFDDGSQSSHPTWKQVYQKQKRIKQWLSFADGSQSSHPTWRQVYQKQNKIKQWLSFEDHKSLPKNNWHIIVQDHKQGLEQKISQKQESNSKELLVQSNVGKQQVESHLVQNAYNSRLQSESHLPLNSDQQENLSNMPQKSQSEKQVQQYRTGEIVPQEREVLLGTEDQKKPESPKQEYSLLKKIVISSVASVIAGGAVWALSKSALKSTLTVTATIGSVLFLTTKKH